jgi:hypothetical protein
MLEKKLISFKIDNLLFGEALHRLAREGGILINMELLEQDYPRDSKELVGISLHLKDVTIRQVLDVLMEKTKHRYYWRQFGDSRVINVIPVERSKDKTHLPNLIVESFRYEDITPHICIRELIKKVLGEEWIMMGQGDFKSQPRFSINLHNVTAREVLNTMSEETNFEWRYLGNNLVFWGRTPSGRVRGVFKPKDN